MSADSQYMSCCVCICVVGLKQDTSSMAACTATSCLNKSDAYWTYIFVCYNHRYKTPRKYYMVSVN